jgi:hypothetical protein
MRCTAKSSVRTEYGVGMIIYEKGGSEAWDFMDYDNRSNEFISPYPRG